MTGQLITARHHNPRFLEHQADSIHIEDRNAGQEFPELVDPLIQSRKPPKLNES